LTAMNTNKSKSTGMGLNPCMNNHITSN